MHRFTLASMLMVTGIILTIAGWKKLSQGGCAVLALCAARHSGLTAPPHDLDQQLQQA